MAKSTKELDCVIIGGGPGGLTAGIYLSRFRCNIKLIDDDNSRAALIPLSHNYPGFPQGISGSKLLSSLRQQYENYGNAIIHNTVNKISYDKSKTNFLIKTLDSILIAKNVILATGVLDVEPVLPNLTLAIKNGLIRHCLICDAYEVINQKIGILGIGMKGIKEAIFLRNYSDDITLFNLDPNLKLTSTVKNKLKTNNIQVISQPISEVIVKDNQITSLKTKDCNYYFDTLYSALGCKVRSELAIQLGANHLKSHFLTVNQHQETNIPGLYAIGDVVNGLNQICVATSQAAIAATHIFNKIKGL